jgi:hypothetical protein
MIVQILKKNPELRTDYEIQKLVPLVNDIKFLEELTFNHFTDVCAELRYESMSKGDVVYK